MATDIIEIGGTKIEVDLDHTNARRIESFKIGDNVRILIRTDYSGATVSPGVIVGFEPFKSLPTIVVAYLNTEYSGSEIKFVYLNAETTKIELVHMLDESFQLDKADVVSRLDDVIAKKRMELDELIKRKNYFLSAFGRHFESKTESEPDHWK